MRQERFGSPLKYVDAIRRRKIYAAGRLHVDDAQKPAHPNLAGVAG
jgi:hypothetical protein